MKKQSNILPLLALLLLALPLHAQLCTIGSSNDLLQSGNQQLFNSYGSSPSFRQHRFTFTLQFTVPSGRTLQVAASASSFAVVATNGMDFSIWGGAGSTPNTGVVVLLINQQPTWTSIRVNYLASARSDFWLGAFSVNPYLQQQSSPNGVVTLSYALNNWASSTASFTIIGEIAGLRTAATSLIIAFVQLNFNPSTGVASASFSLSASPAVENVVISYIIFSNASPIQMSTFNLNSGTSLPYQFSGMDRIESGSSIISSYAFSSGAQSGLTCIGSRCPSTCVTAQTCVASSGTITSTSCFLCASGQVVSNGQCTTPNQCGTNQYFNGVNCVCNSGYIMIGGVCYISCGNNAYVYQGTCQCIPGYIFSNTQNQCVSQTSIQCGTNEINNNGVCVCPPPYGKLNNVCRTCPANSYVNNNGLCTCLPGYDLNPSTTTCGLSCFANAYRNPNNNQCQCVNGYYLQGNTCIPQGTCTGGLVWNGQTCVCPAPQVRDSITNQCTFCNTLGRQISNGICVCSSTYYPTQTGCSPCPANSQYSSTTGTCVCNTGYTLNNGVCTPNQNCPFNSFFNTTTQRCQCNQAGQFIINGVCAVCQPNSQYSYNTGTCVCNQGYTFNNGLCQQNCGANSAANSQGTCVCNSGYYIIGGVCQLCDPNSVYSNTQFTCICNDGYYGTFSQCNQCHSSCRTCRGAGAANCTGCATGFSLNSNNQCVANAPTCPSGQFLNSTNQCQPCTANCILCFAANQCTSCAPGFTANSLNNQGTIITSCSANPTSTSATISLRGNTLDSPRIYQGVAMTTMPSAILANGCTICDSLLVININSLYTTITSTVRYVPNSQYWFTITFDFSGTTVVVPTFEYTVRINPVHANFFTTQDMAQVLRGAFNEDSFRAVATASLNIPNTPGNLQNRGGSLGGSRPGQDNSLSSNTILTLFGGLPGSR